MVERVCEFILVCIGCHNIPGRVEGKVGGRSKVMVSVIVAVNRLETAQVPAGQDYTLITYSY